MNEAYAKLLDQAGAADAWKQKFRPVLGPLAIAGTGSVLPLSLLAHSSKALGGPESVEDIRDVLSRLRGLVVRRDAGEMREHVGLFHTTLAEYLLGSSAAEAGYAIDAGAVHRAMVQAIEALAPMAEHNKDDSLHRYAFLREADHLWALGDMERLLACLRSRDAYSPRENLERWRQWLPRLRERFDEDSPTILELLARIAFWTGQAGDAPEALRLFHELLPDMEQVKGRDHPDTLNTRSNIASWTGRVGNAPEGAATLHRAAAGPGAGAGPRPPRHAQHPQQHRVLDRRGGRRARGAATLHRAAAGPGAGAGPRPPRHGQHPQQHRVLDRRGGRRARALQLFTALLPDRERVLGRDHPDTVNTRSNIASWTGEVGDVRAALQLFTALLPDRERVLGRDHPDTLTTRSNIASWTGRVGDARGAATLHRAAAGPGAGAGPRPPRHAQHPRFRRDLGHQEW